MSEMPDERQTGVAVMDFVPGFRYNFDEGCVLGLW